MADNETKGFSLLPGNREWMQKSDLLMGIGIIAVVVMLIIPLPTFILDFLMAVSIMIALLILMIVMFIHRSFDFSVFPSLLLVSTVFRLALNVSSTRLILLDGASFDGKIIKAFGNFVVGGNYIVGLIIFIILVAVQFLVITKGATRTAEVAARFTLDAMPGKQMSIDADLSNGVITDEEAKTRRGEIRKEADFYGAMDGASKFVQGDVKVGLIITVINIFGGFLVGMLIRGEAFDVALKTYTLLSIGDGLVSQIPSLLITTATGVIVTRANSDSDENLGDQLSKQLGSQPKALYITSGALAASTLIPGFPVISMIILSALMGGLGFILSKSQHEREVLDGKKVESEAQKERKPEDVISLIHVDPLEVEIGYNLIPLVDPDQGGSLLERITNIRRKSALDMGLLVPPIRIRDNLELAPEVYQILIKGVEVGLGSLQVDRLMAMDSGDVVDKIEGDQFVEPVFNLNAIWIDSDMKDQAERNGYTVVDCPTIVATHLTEIIKRHASEILGRQEVKKLIENVQDDFSAVVEEINEKMSLGEIQQVLQNLLRERISIRNMVTILETLTVYQKYTQDSGLLTEFVRSAISGQITNDYLDENKILNVITVDPEIESIIRMGIHDDPIEGQVLGLDPDTHNIIRTSLVDAFNKAKNLGYQPVFLVSPQIRSVTFTLMEREVLVPVVISYSEIGKSVKVNVVISALITNAA